MRKTLLFVCLVATACAKHAGESIAITKNSPQAPINQPDSTQPPTDPITSGGGSGSSGSTIEDPNGGGSGTPGDGQGSGSGGSSSSGGPNGPETGGPGSGGPNGGPSQPVPEPGTLLLVGTGLASIALLRRRRDANQSAN